MNKYPVLHEIAQEFEREIVSEPLYRGPWEGIGRLYGALHMLERVIIGGDPAFAVRIHAIRLGAAALKFLLSQPTWRK
jgi:hypothetical protein